MKLNPDIIDLIQDALNNIPNGTKKAFSFPEVDQSVILFLISTFNNFIAITPFYIQIILPV